MKSNFLSFTVMMVGCFAFAQNATLSPYSYYGIGQPVSTRTAENNTIGGVTTYADSTQFSLDNPATLGKLKYVQYRLGANYKSTVKQSPLASESATTASLNYLALSVPTKHFVFSFGLKPKTATGYRINTTNTQDGVEYNNKFTGSGGVNSTFLGIALNPIDGLSLGVSAFYNFGFNEKIYLQTLTGVQNSTQFLTRSELSGIHFTLGMHYSRTIFSEYMLQLSATYTPNATLESNNTRTISTITPSGNLGTQSKIDLKNLTITTNKFAAESTFGLGFGKPQHWFAGVTYANASQGITNPLQNSSGVNYVAASRFSAGGFYIPKYDSFTNYLSRVVYRLGTRWEHLGMELNNNGLKDFGISFGIGLPMNVLSKVNIGVELGQYGTTDAGLVKENYTNIMLGFSLSDLWFIKRKYD